MAIRDGWMGLGRAGTSPSLRSGQGAARNPLLRTGTPRSASLPQAQHPLLPRPFLPRKSHGTHRPQNVCHTDPKMCVCSYRMPQLQRFVGKMQFRHRSHPPAYVATSAKCAQPTSGSSQAEPLNKEVFAGSTNTTFLQLHQIH